VGFSAFFGERDLLLTFSKSGFLCLRHFLVAVMARDAFFIFGTLLFVFCDWTAAGETLIIFRFFKPMCDGNALVEDKTITFPKTL